MKTSFQNRHGQKIVVLIDEAPNQKGLAFVMHGLGGFKEQPHVETFAKAFLENGYTAVRFDTANTIGESEGKYEDATVTNYYEDLEDVIDWAKSQKWYQEPFCLAGHSLGGISVALYAERHPEKTKGVAPISAVISGKLSEETKMYRGTLEDWKKTGWQIRESKSKAGTILRLPWSHMEDRLKYDLLPGASKLTMPVLLVVGDQDDGTPPKHQKLFYDKLSCKKELHIIKGAPHTFREPVHLREIKDIFSSWIKKID